MSRIKISLGDVQIEYDGEQEFIDAGLLTLAKEIMDLRRREIRDPNIINISSNDQARLPEHSTNTIAQIIGAKTGSDLALAAIAKIILIKRKPVADRQEVLDEMKEASTFYKETYASNLSSYLDTLVKSKRVNLVSRATYGLAAGERGRLEQAIANGA